MIINIKQLIMNEAPEEVYDIQGKQVIVRRDDLAYMPPLPPNAKMSALYAIVKRASEQGYRKVVMFAKKQQGTSYAIGLPVFCEMFNMEAIITIPLAKDAPLPDWFFQIRTTGPKVRIIRLHPNMVTINVNQSRKIAAEHEAYFIPFGFDDALSVDIHANKFSLPNYEIGTLIMSTMTGMILAGTLRQIAERHYRVKKIIAVSGGRPIESVYASMNKYIRDLFEYGNQLDNLNIVNPYDRSHIAIIPDKYDLFPTHPDYERKAWLWMIENIDGLIEPIYFINAGR